MGMALNMMVFGRTGSHKSSSNRNTARPEIKSSGRILINLFTDLVEIKQFSGQHALKVYGTGKMDI